MWILARYREGHTFWGHYPPGCCPPQPSSWGWTYVQTGVLNSSGWAPPCMLLRQSPDGSASFPNVPDRWFGCFLLPRRFLSGFPSPGGMRRKTRCRLCRCLAKSSGSGRSRCKGCEDNAMKITCRRGKGKKKAGLGKGSDMWLVKFSSDSFI